MACDLWVGLVFAMTAQPDEASARLKYKKGTGLSCSKCHTSPKSAKPTDDAKLKLYNKAIKHKPRKGGDCNACHKGQRVPPKG